MKFDLRSFQDLFLPQYSGSSLAKDVLATYRYTSLTQKYEAEYSGQAFQDESFVFFYNDEPVLALAVTAKEERLSFFGSPLKLFIKQDIKEDVLLELKIVFFQKLNAVIKAHLIKKMSFYDHPLMNDFYFAEITGHEMILNSVINLHETETTILRNFRKSYRSLINWGEREIKIVQIDQNNPDADLFDEFRKFHVRVSGKETRTRATWDMQLEMVKNGEAFLILGFLESTMVAGALVLLGKDEAYYGVAVNDRSLMGLNKPLGHSTVYRSIILAKQLGLSRFNLGPVLYTGMNEKEKQIGIFKKGFSGTMEGNLIIQVEISHEHS